MKRLKSDQLSILLMILKNNNIDLKVQENLKHTSGFTSDIDEIRLTLDILSNEFSKNLNKANEPTELGKQIDELITFFSNLAIKYEII